MDRYREGEQRFAITLPPDDDGFIGRGCPNKECGRYFKITNGTGLTGENLPCHCPYCGCTSDQQEFTTEEQVEYGKSLVHRKVLGDIEKELKKSEFDIRGPFGMRFSMRVKSDGPVAIRYYEEKRLETTLVCDSCGLRYAIYGVFAFCPDCARHNSLQILEKNLEVVTKKVEWASSVDSELANSLVEDALANVVAAFDGFGREICRVHAASARDEAKALRISFQNLEAARERVRQQFSLDLARGLVTTDWDFADRCFQRRHLLAHKMGVVDAEYIKRTSDTTVAVGQRIMITEADVRVTLETIRKLASELVRQFDHLNSSIPE